jgi:hypothetical protein
MGRKKEKGRKEVINHKGTEAQRKKEEISTLVDYSFFLQCHYLLPITHYPSPITQSAPCQTCQEMLRNVKIL